MIESTLAKIDRPALISVVMPAYNAAPHVRRAVESALAQSYRNIELIVVDDGSTDGTAEILESIVDPRVKIIWQPNAGVCAARNRALAEAAGEFVAFLDADDTWAQDCLEKLLAPLLRDGDAVLAYCGWQNIGLRGPQGQPFIPPDFQRCDKLEALLEGCRWPIHAAITRVEAIRETGGFDVRFVTSEDYSLWLRIATRRRILRVPEVLAFYHHYSGTRATRNRVRAAQNRRRVKLEFLACNRDLARRLGRRRIRQVTLGPTLRTAYECYWDRELEAARTLFRMVMRAGYGSLRDWKYMLPSLLPVSLHRWLIHRLEKKENTISAT